jgi:hypothetical protein
MANDQFDPGSAVGAAGEFRLPPRADVTINPRHIAATKINPFLHVFLLMSLLLSTFSAFFSAHLLETQIIRWFGLCVN